MRTEWPGAALANPAAYGNCSPRYNTSLIFTGRESLSLGTPVSAAGAGHASLTSG